ncbi:MAG: hypothetical protein Ta2B_15830 [Termitinemataceae bacterium]|nr:MAG: hypothetical protein Ta2B_15830 [Termitinemataceae bacterium]
MKNLTKIRGKVSSYNKVSNLFATLLLAATVLVAVSCAGEGDTLPGGGSDPKTPYDPKQAYPITVTVAQGSFQGGGEYVTAPFVSVAPTVAASVNSAKQGDKVTINISNIPEGFMLDGVHTIVKSEDGSRPGLDKNNKFTMPAGPVTVDVVFMSVGDFLKSSVAYDKTLYTLDIEKGQLDTPAPGHEEPYTTAYPTGDTNENQYWGAGVAASGYSATDRTVTQITPIGNNSGAATTWDYKDGIHLLSTVGDGESSYKAFYIVAQVSPQILSIFPTLEDIPPALQTLTLIDDEGKTVAVAYTEAKIAGPKSYYFEVRLREPAVNAYLFALNISTITTEFELAPAIQNNGNWGDTDNPWDYSTVTLNAAAVYEVADSSMMEFNVTAESYDGNAMVKIGDQSYKAGSNENSITYDNQADGLPGPITFDISVQAENDACTKVYTVVITKAVPKYSSEVTGGSKYFIEEGTKAYEVHAFYIGSRDTIVAGGQKTAELNFGSSTNIPATAEILVVAGGGAGAMSGGMGGGGGGGVIHYSAISLANVGTKTGSNGLIYPVKVGAGGAVSTTARQVSQNGGDSEFGEGNNRLVAPGGGGGGAFPTGAGRAFKGADGGNGGGGGTGYNWYADIVGWGPHDDLTGTMTDGNGNTAGLGRAQVTPFRYSKQDNGSSIAVQAPDNIKTYPATNASFTTVGYTGDLSVANPSDPVKVAYQQSQSWNVADYKVQHTGHAFGNRGGWAEGISNSSGGSGAGTDAWRWSHYGRNSGDTGGQGIMFNTSGQWRWYSMGGPGGYRCFQPFSGGWGVAGASQTGTGGASGFAGGSGTVIVRWEITYIP